MNNCACLLGTLNHIKTVSVFFYRLRLVSATIIVYSLEYTSLLIMPFSDFVGLISRHVGLFWKFGLWSFNVIKAFFEDSASILLRRFRSVAILFSSEMTWLKALLGAFLIRLCD